MYIGKSVSSPEVLELVGKASIEIEVRKRQIEWPEHARLMKNDRLPKICYSANSMKGIIKEVKLGKGIRTNCMHRYKQFSIIDLRTG